MIHVVFYERAYLVKFHTKLLTRYLLHACRIAAFSQIAVYVVKVMLVRLDHMGMH